MEKQRLLYLLNQQADKNLTETELRELEQWYHSLNSSTTKFEVQNPSGQQLADEMLIEFGQNYIKQTPTVRKMSLPQLLIRVAAVVIGISLIGATYFFFSRGKQKEIAQTDKQEHHNNKDLAPGGNKAILTLANGAQIILDSAANGTLAQQGNTKVVKLANGRLAYNSTGNRQTAVLYNTMSVPRGGQYKLTLPDGTEVWLNAASSIRYPTAFTGTERKVEISGEAYFEVAHYTAAGTGKRIPFKVMMNNGEEIEVLGTHFNVNAYPEEGNVKTTLLEGAVKLTQHHISVLIKPGQQAALTEKGFKIDNPDIEKVIAWKTGFFDFDNLDLVSIMRQISRWYDVDIVYDGRLTTPKFGGRISRDLPLSSVLKMFEEYHIAFRLEGKKLHVEV